MVRAVSYSGRVERKAALDAANVLNEIMLHDDFTNDEGTNGILTFDVFVEPIPTVEEIRQKELSGKLSDKTITHEELVELLVMERSG